MYVSLTFQETEYDVVPLSIAADVLVPVLFLGLLVVHLFVNLRNQFSELILISIFLFNCMIFLYA